MDTQALIDEFRSRIEDTLDPFLWEDEEVIAFLVRAEREACLRARLLEDNSTPAVCEIPLVATQRRYSLHPSVDIVRHAKMDGRPLAITSLEQLDAQCGDWETRSGRPCALVREGQGAIVLDRAPTALEAGKILRLRVFRFPLEDLSLDEPDREPEINVQHHDGLIDWMIREAYMKKDTETYDPVKAADHEALFAARFGKRPDANVQRKQRDRRMPGTVFNPGW